MTIYPSQFAQIPLGDLENMNTDRSVEPPTMLRGQLARTSAGNWVAMGASLNSHTGNSELRVFQENHICLQNSTSTALSANQTFTGEWQDCLNYQEVNVSIVSDKDSAINGLVFQWSADGVNVGDTDVFSYYTASGGTNYTPNPSFRYVRMYYTNGAQAQTSFSLQTILRRGVTGGSFHRIDSTLKDDADGRLQISVPKLRTAANTYVSQTATTAGNAKISLEEIDTTLLAVGPWTGVSGLRVYGGPTDPISDIPVGIDFEHHQVHEGETYKATYDEGIIGTGLTKYSVSVSAFSTGIRAPHMIVGCDIYNGAAKISLYKSATIAGGTTITSYNRNTQISSLPSTVIKHSVSSSNGTMIDSFLVGAGNRAAGQNRSQAEWVLSANTDYRVDMQGVVAGTSAIMHFDWYEDEGV